VADGSPEHPLQEGRHRGARRRGRGEGRLNEVELVTIGDELLLGFTVDTNGAFLARKLAEQGIAVARRTAVGDTVEAIASAVREALDRTGAVITTGGLGPTSDDVTRDAVAQVFGRELRVDEAHLLWMRERWKKRFGRDMPESNRRQAMIPDGARKLDNKHGSAPGVFIEDDRDRWVVMLPGVPRELRGMTDDTLLPLLRERGCGQDGECIKSRTWRTTGVAESLLADTLAGVDAALAYLPGVDGVDLRMSVRAPSAAEADRALDKVGAALRAAVGESMYGEGDDDLARVLLDLCRSRNLEIAVAESCTGGLLGARITAIPGSSDVFVGGVIAYSDEVKVRELGVSEATLREHGAVSEEVVRQMAVGAQKKFGVDVALAITGVAGPGGGTTEKPVGLVWICAAVGDRVEPRKIQLWGDRQEIRYRAAQASMELARRMLTAAPKRSDAAV
jgi:nicotinamide-nucleotide amidase